MYTKLICRYFVLCLFLLTCVNPFTVYAQQNSESVGSKAAVLLIGDHTGIEEAEANSVAQLIAVELRRLGISVNDPVIEAPTIGTVYRISFNPLGEKILVRLIHESPIENIIDERQLWISNIEEMIEAAPRLVDALINKKPISSTADVESVVQGDSPVMRKISGESFWSVGLFGTFVPGTNLIGEFGVETGLSYERPTYGIETEFRFTGGEESEGDSFVYTSWSIGGRYFFNKQNISPYVGGGLGLSIANYRTKITRRDKDWYSDEWWYYDDYDSETDTGMGAYVIGGIEMLRLYRNRLNLEIRIDRTFFQLPTQDVVPITFGIYYSSNYILGDFGLF